MSNKSLRFSDSLKFLFEEKGEDLESLQTSQDKAKNNIVCQENIYRFPFFFLGKICFFFEGQETCCSGLLIGTDIVLSSASYFVKVNKNRKITVPKNCEFFAGLNGDLEVFQSVKSNDVYVPEEYISGIKNSDPLLLSENDYALIYLSQPIGNNILEIFDLKNKPEFKVEKDHFFHFFLNNEKLNFEDIVKNCASDKVSVLGYKEKNLRLSLPIPSDSPLNVSNSFTNSISSISDQKKQPILDYVILYSEGQGGKNSNKNNKNSNSKGNNDNDEDKPYIYENKTTINSDNIEYSIKDTNINNTKNSYINFPKNSISGAVFLRYKRIANNKNSEIIYQFLGICNKNNKEIKCLNICGNIVKKIVELFEKNANNNIENDYSFNDEKNDNIKSEYLNVKLTINKEPKFSFLIKRQLKLDVIFSFAEKVLNIPKEYILLIDSKAKNGISNIQNYKYDNAKKIYEIIDDPVNSLSESFELMLNIKVYGEHMGNIILHKFLETYDLEKKQVKTQNKKYLKMLFNMIFREISMFENIPLIHGKLFKKIRTIILKKLDIENGNK